MYYACYFNTFAGRWLPMLRGVIKSLYNHYGLDPVTYTVVRTEETEDVQGDTTQTAEDVQGDTTQTAEDVQGDVPQRLEKDTSQLEVPKTPGDYSDEEVLDQPLVHLSSPTLPQLSIPKTPGNDIEVQQPPVKKRKTLHTPIAKRKAKRHPKKRVIYSPTF